MSIDVKKYVSGCDSCQRNKSAHNMPYGLLQPIEIPHAPWDVVTFDLIVDLPKSVNRFGLEVDSILVIMDKLSKMTHLFTCDKHISALEIAEIFYHFIFRLHGLMRQMICDRDPRFAGEVFQEFCKLMGIKSSISTPYHPETDGQTERQNQVVEQYLCTFCSY